MNEEQIFTYRKNSLYKIARKAGEKRLNVGFNYRDEVMKRTVSPHMLRNPLMANFLTFINDYVVNLINGARRIKISRNYTVDKDYEYID